MVHVGRVEYDPVVGDGDDGQTSENVYVFPILKRRLKRLEDLSYILNSAIGEASGLCGLQV